MFILEFAGMVLVAALAIYFLASAALKLHERHVEWKYRLERKKHEDELTDKFIDGGK
jgi:hypothetical protein